MCCKLNFDIDLLSYQKNIAYKYLIHSPQRMLSAEGDKTPYELLYQTPFSYGGIVNRCLVIPSERCKPKGSFVNTLVCHNIK